MLLSLHPDYVMYHTISPNGVDKCDVSCTWLFDKKTIEVVHKGKKSDSGRRKLGAIIGKNVNTGINASINAGSIIGNDVKIGPNTLISGTYESKSTIV